MRARAALLVLALVAALVGIEQPVTASATSAGAPTPVVSGNRLIDTRTNTDFVPHGANWPSFEYACSQGWAYSQDDDTNAAAAAMQSWGINTVRVPLNQNCWLGSDPSDYMHDVGYRAAVAAWVSILNAHGMVVILDLHWSAPTGQHALGQWPMADSNSIPFWTSVASVYAGNPSIIFDAFNEPYSIWDDANSSYSFQLTWSCWQNGGCQAPLVTTNQVPIIGAGAGTYTVVGMSQLVAAIRAGGAAQPIMLGGLNYSNDLSGWLAHKPADSQLVASWHNYPGQSSCGYKVSCWNTETSAVAASVPIVTGEFGETDGGSSSMTAYMNWADSKGIGYLPWAWWNADDVPGDAALYALFQGSSFAPHAPTGTNYRAHLAGLAPPPAPVFHTMPVPMTFPSPATADVPVATTDPAASRAELSAPELDQLALVSLRNLHVSSY
jgi:endoglucanase